MKVPKQHQTVEEPEEERREKLKDLRKLLLSNTIQCLILFNVWAYSPYNYTVCVQNLVNFSSDKS